MRICVFLQKCIELFFDACYTRKKYEPETQIKSKKGGSEYMYSAVDLSKYIVTKCINDGQPISNLQLQKILYYVQKEYLNRGTRAFGEEIEAWQFGPVVPEAYYRFSGFGAMPITLSYRTLIDQADRQIIDPIVEEKRNLNPWTLVEETHRPDGAWSQVFRNGIGNHKVIPVALIKAVG